jgi:hypothetical protein
VVLILEEHIQWLTSKTNEQTTRNITPKGKCLVSIWKKIFTDDYKTISPEYKDFLMKFTQQNMLISLMKPYIVEFGQNQFQHTHLNYNLSDIS